MIDRMDGMDRMYAIVGMDGMDWMYEIVGMDGMDWMGCDGMDGMYWMDWMQQLHPSCQLVLEGIDMMGLYLHSMDLGMDVSNLLEFSAFVLPCLIYGSSMIYGMEEIDFPTGMEEMDGMDGMDFHNTKV